MSLNEGTDTRRRGDVVTTRYGVFLTPDPVTCAAVSTVTGLIRAQYGFVSAAAFPPHATLAGSLPLRASVDELITTLDGVLSRWEPFRVENAGVRKLGEIVVYDVNQLGAAQNVKLRRLAFAIDAAVRPLLSPTGGLPADVHSESNFHAHLSLASHELFTRTDLQDEVAAFASALPVVVPAAFQADTVTLYRFEHPSWDGPWWRSMDWEHVRTWRLGLRRRN